jgi:hypothetical protein
MTKRTRGGLTLVSADLLEAHVRFPRRVVVNLDTFAFLPLINRSTASTAARVLLSPSAM